MQDNQSAVSNRLARRTLIRISLILPLFVIIGNQYQAKSGSSISSGGLPVYPTRLVLFEAFVRST
jgi:hypothetical protein